MNLSFEQGHPHICHNIYDLSVHCLPADKAHSFCYAAQLWRSHMCYVNLEQYIFRHLKLEIALAIPASNDEK